MRLPLDDAGEIEVEITEQGLLICADEKAILVPWDAMLLLVTAINSAERALSSER